MLYGPIIPAQIPSFHSNASTCLKASMISPQEIETSQSNILTIVTKLEKEGIISVSLSYTLMKRVEKKQRQAVRDEQQSRVNQSVAFYIGSNWQKGQGYRVKATEKALAQYGKEWTFEEMNSYLIKPQAYIKGTKMAFAGLRKEKDRASVILYMCPV